MSYRFVPCLAHPDGRRIYDWESSSDTLEKARTNAILSGRQCSSIAKMRCVLCEEYDPSSIQSQIPIQAWYCSEWDDGIVVQSRCIWDPTLRVAREVEDVDIDNLDLLHREYVLLPDGTEIPVDSEYENDLGIPEAGGTW